MKARYRLWVENLNWDWCISRQRYFGVPFPVWYCKECGEVILADEGMLPVDPLQDRPSHPCTCGSTSFIPEQDILDTWATSSMTPQIAGGWSKGREASASSSPALDGQYNQVFPYSLRPQAHEIIRTWAFYTIAKSQFHFETLPWKDVMISGWGIAGEGMGKISKSRGSGPMSPLEMLDRYSADAVRYWAASTGPGKDSVISEEKIQMGAKLVTKLWNVARFCENFVLNYQSFAPNESFPPGMTPADRWILARLQSLVRRVTESLEGYEYAAAKSEIESFFWRELADNYLEMIKLRLYDPANPGHRAARFTLYHALLTTLKLLAPFLPYVTEEIYQELFARNGLQRANSEGQVIEGVRSIHLSRWPKSDPFLEDAGAEALGEVLVRIATAVRRYKSERKLALGLEVDRLQLATMDSKLAGELIPAVPDLMGVTRARRVEIVESLESTFDVLERDEVLSIGIYP
jgi:valyl-tRNA synthetase